MATISLGTSPAALDANAPIAQAPEKQPSSEAPAKVPGGVSQQRPPAIDKWSYVGLDVIDRKSHEVVPIQLAVHRRGDAYIVKTATKSYDITAALAAQPQRYFNANGSIDQSALRELLQTQVNNGAISVGAGDRREGGVIWLTDAGGAPLGRPEGGPHATNAIDDALDARSDLQGKMLGIGLEATAIAFGVGEVSAALRTFKTLSAAKAAGQVLSAADSKLLKSAEVTLTSYGVGAMAGGTSYALFIDQKYWDEAYSAMAAGRPLEGLSFAAKAAVTLMNWTTVPGSISNNLARTNVKIGLNAAIQTLGRGKLHGFNWGMFIDPKAWTPANIVRVMGQARGEQVLAKYRPVFDELAALRATGQPLVTNKGVLRVSERAVREAGFDSLPALADAMTRDGLWRVFTFKPVLNSPFGFAVHSSPGATANATFQLAASRAATGVGANLALQSLSDFGFNGSIDINWEQAIAAAAGGGPRGMGAPGAWVGTFRDRLISYGSSSAAGFAAQWWTKGMLAARQQEAETFTSEQLSAIGNANQALNGMAMLLDAYDKAGKPAPSALFDSTPGKVGLGEAYAQRLEGLASAPADEIAEHAKRLDEWLDTPIATNGRTRRERLSLVSMPEPLAETLVGNVKLRELYKTGTMQDLGFAPKFSEPVKPAR
jgi:hypothetical protein